MLGEHTYEVLSGFGFTETQLHELANDGVITQNQGAQHA